MKTPGTQTSASKAYQQAIQELRGSVSGFEAARDSLKQAAQNLNEIVKTHESVSRSLGETEDKLQELVPDVFQKQLLQNYKEAASFLESVSTQSRLISEASEDATRAFMDLRDASEQGSKDLQSRMDSEAKVIIQWFSRETKEATTSVAADLKHSLDHLSSDAAELTAQLESQQLQKVMKEFRLELENATKQISIASGAMSASGEGFRLLLVDARSSVKTILDNLSRSETQIPRWGLYLLVSQAVVIVMLLVSMFV